MVKATNIPADYKLTDVGVIPIDWEVKKLGEIAEIATGNTPPTNDLNNYGDDYLFVGPADLGRSKYILDTVKKLSKKGFNISRKFPQNSILFTCIGSTIGKSGIAPIMLTSNQQINAIFPNDSYSTHFVYYILNYIALRIKSSVSEQAVPIINKSTFEAIQFSFPPLPEQQAIAGALSDVDALLTSLEQLLAKKRNIKQGAMQQLLTGKKRLPGFTGEWEVKKLGEIAEIIMGQSPSSAFYNANTKGLPLVQGNADIENRKTIIRFYTSSITKRCYSGDIIMTVRAPVGKIAKTSFDACIGRGVCSISYSNNYLYHYLIFFEDSWSKISKGSTFDSINSSDVMALEILIPSTIREQTAIAEILSDMDKEIEALEKKREKYKAIKQGMMQELLTGKTRLI